MVLPRQTQRGTSEGYNPRFDHQPHHDGFGLSTYKKNIVCNLASSISFSLNIWVIFMTIFDSEVHVSSRYLSFVKLLEF